MKAPITVFGFGTFILIKTFSKCPKVRLSTLPPASNYKVLVVPGPITLVSSADATIEIQGHDNTGVVGV